MADRLTNSAAGGATAPSPPGAPPRITIVPAGLWIRSAQDPQAQPDDPVFSAVPHAPDVRTLIVGAPGCQPPALADVTRALDDLSAQATVIVSMYGCEPGDGPGLAQRLAAAAGRPVVAEYGLLMPGQDGVPRVLATDAGRRESWAPFAQRVLHPPGGPPRLVHWHPPVVGMVPHGRAGYRLVGPWFVRVVPAGLALRRVGLTPDAATDVAPFDPARLDLAVDGPVAELTDNVLTALSRFADALPAAARVRLRLVLSAGTDDMAARRLRLAVPAPQHVRLPVPAEAPSAGAVSRESAQPAQPTQTAQTAQTAQTTQPARSAQAVRPIGRASPARPADAARPTGGAPRRHAVGRATALTLVVTRSGRMCFQTSG
ncbi:hypothetical protein [Parafrankia sp. EUN1f]|uniref:hypothetical protein n=1 Tax=Parafrankia sp. EUN1f TaxID=102897 RepID=UPI0001C470CD|nr:hypothetical protein [Parafrankia sp. EUN1f]EFC80127.1 hypothetical protein FrEUN1fDRAFT_6764 [Parafrankia sp. EUN1f]